MEVAKRASSEYNYSLGGSGLASSSRYSCHSAGDDTTGSGSGSGLIRHSDTQFDSSADETVIPYMIGERASQEFISTNSIAESFDPEASPKSHLSRATRRSIECGTLYEETVQLELDLQHSRGYNQVMADPDNNIEGVEESHENQRLVSSSVDQPTAVAAQKPKREARATKATKADYRVGSCYHCLINVPPGSLIAWIFVFIATIGWAVSTWLSLDFGKDLLGWLQKENMLSYEEIVLIAIALATVVITVVFLIIATFSSQKMSRYSFSSSKKNKFGYCLSITVVVLSFLCVLFWTGIVGLTMMPLSILSVVHLLVNTNSLKCIHLQSYGVGIGKMAASMVTVPSVVTTTNATALSANSSVGVGAMARGNITANMANGLLCDSDLQSWMDEAWRVLVPLLISLAFAVAVEACMLGFLVAASSNARHLKERMAYINEPYSYSTENVNGNVKPISQDKSASNNNDTDTQI